MNTEKTNIVFEVLVTYKKEKDLFFSLQTTNYFNNLESARNFAKKLYLKSKEDVEGITINRKNLEII